MSTPPALEFEDVWFAYTHEQFVLQSISLRVLPGTFVAILGANGSGKTTMLKLAAGLIGPCKGRVLVESHPINAYSLRERCSRIGLVFQNPADQLFGTRVEDDVAFGPRNLGLSKEEVEHRVTAALEAVGASHLRTRLVHQLSFGEQRRVALAGVLAMSPRLLLLDEVTTGLDPATEWSILKLLDKIRRQYQMTVVLATHSIDPIPVFADYVCVLHNGEVLATGRPRDVFAQPELLARARLRTPYVCQLFELLERECRLELDMLPMTVEQGVETIRELLRLAASTSVSDSG